MAVAATYMGNCKNEVRLKRHFSDFLPVLQIHRMGSLQGRGSRTNQIQLIYGQGEGA
jgi:hypothetical protein